MLQERLDNLTKLLKSNPQEVVKTSRIKNMYMQSSAFYLWLITGVLAYANKIPIIRNIIALLSLWYGRSTWWKILVKIRKAFITFNAIIGMYMVYKTTGFSFDHILAGFTGMGHTYVEIFYNFNRKVYNWLYNLIDSKVVPNIPKNPPSNPPITDVSSWFPKTNATIEPTNKPNWFSGPYSNNTLDKEEFFSLRKLYMDNPINININTTPWYKDYTNWLLLGGGLACVGVLYIGIKIIMDPLLINDLPLIGKWFRTPLDQASTNVTPTQETVGGAPDLGEGSSTLSSIGTAVLGGLKKLNPATWFMSSVDYDNSVAAFTHAQSNVGYNPNHYPFTRFNPYDSWIRRMRISWLGETTLEESTRHAIRSGIWSDVMPDLDITTTLLPPSSSISSSLTATPNIGTVGLGLNLTNMDVGFMNVASKFSSVSNTPTQLPVALPEMTNAFNDRLGDALERLKGHTSPVIEASSSKVIIDNLPKTFSDVVKTAVSTPVSVPVESTPLSLPVDIPPVIKVASVVTKTVTLVIEASGSNITLDNLINYSYFNILF